MAVLKFNSVILFMSVVNLIQADTLLDVDNTSHLSSGN